MWQWAKACKGAALIAFFLPWMTVSCSSTELMRASGWDLATGHPRLAPQLAQMAGDHVGRDGGHLSVWLLLALAAIVAGLIFSLRPARGGAAAVLASSIAAIMLVLIGTRQLSNEALSKAAARQGSGDGLGRAMAAQIHVDWQLGYWLCMGALITAAVLAGTSLGRRGGAVP